MKRKISMALLSVMLLALLFLPVNTKAASTETICSGSGYISDSNTSKSYSFNLSSSGKITLTSTASMSYVDYYISDSSGDVWSKSCSANSSGQCSINEDLDLTKGSYTLKIKRSYGSAGSYSFKLTFAGAGESFTETGSGTNNTISQASSISTGSSYKGQIAKNDTKDFYRFTMNSSGKITLTSAALMRYAYYRVYDSQGSEVWSKSYSANSSGQCSVNEVLNLTKGTYYLGIESSYGATGNYSFKLDFTSAGESFTETGSGTNNTIAEANGVSVGISYKGQIARNDTKDFYRYTIGSSGKYDLMSTVLMSYVRCCIYNSQGDEVWYGYYDANSSGQCNINEVVDLSKGTYYLGFESRYSSTGNYSFKLTPHSHSYTSDVRKASTFSNGLVKYECKCGAAKQTIIYAPSKLSISPSAYTYDGKAKTPKVTVKDSSGKTINSSNYTVTYPGGRKKPGSYTIQVTFKGNYSGTMWQSFVIKPKGTAIAKLKAKSGGFTIKVKRQASQTSGYQIQYSTSRNFKNKTTKTITKNSKTTASYTSLKPGKKYYVRVRTYKKVSGTKYYSSWSDAKTVKTKR